MTTETKFSPLALNAEAERDELASALSALRAEHQETVEALALMKEVAAQAQKERDEARQIVIDAIDETYAAEHAGLRAQLAEAERARDECAEGESLRAIERDEARAALAASEGTREERDRLHALLNTPEIVDFAKAVHLEAAHQRERWEPGHDASKTDSDWFWLIGYLAGKALHNPGVTPEDATEKKLHRIVTIAAAAANWHAVILGPSRSAGPAPGVWALRWKAAARRLFRGRRLCEQTIATLRSEREQAQRHLAEARKRLRIAQSPPPSAGPASEAKEKCGIRISGDEWCALPHPHDGPHRGKHTAPASEAPKR